MISNSVEAVTEVMDKNTLTDLVEDYAVWAITCETQRIVTRNMLNNDWHSLVCVFLPSDI